MEEYIKWECIVCGLIYDEAEGWPEDGIEPGTKWEDVPFDWVCPCLLYTSPSPRDGLLSRMPSSA